MGNRRLCRKIKDRNLSGFRSGHGQVLHDIKKPDEDAAQDEQAATQTAEEKFIER